MQYRGQSYNVVKHSSFALKMLLLGYLVSDVSHYDQVNLKPKKLGD